MDLLQPLVNLPDNLRAKTIEARKALLEVAANLTGSDLKPDELSELECRARDLFAEKRHPRYASAVSAVFTPLIVDAHARAGEEQRRKRVQAYKDALAGASRTVVEMQHPGTDPYTVIVNDGSITEKTERTCAILAANSQARVYRQGLALSRLRSDSERINIEALTMDSLHGELDRVVTFVQLTKMGDEKRVDPPYQIVRGVYTWPDYSQFKTLRGLTFAPFVSPSGRIVDQVGYDAESEVYLADTLRYEPIPDVPTAEDVQQAVALLREPFCDFPFSDGAGLAHSFGLLLTPIVRDLIHGPTPIHAIDASQPGTGKGLLTKIVWMILTGRDPSGASLPDSDDEIRKKVLSALLAGSALIFFDNIARKVDSAALAAASTAGEWEDRVLGSSRVMVLPIRCGWLLTGNNLSFSEEITRRVVWTRLVSIVPDPHTRNDFKHADIMAWVREHRPALFRAALVLVRNWLARGRPAYTGTRLGSYEVWSDVVGGVLQAAGIEGFLSNLDAQAEETNLDRGGWSLFIEEWWKAFGRAIKPADVLLPLAEACDLLDEDVTADASERAKVTRLGILLGHRRERVWRLSDGTMVKLNRHTSGGGDRGRAPRRGWFLAPLGQDSRTDVTTKERSVEVDTPSPTGPTGPTPTDTYENTRPATLEKHSLGTIDPYIPTNIGFTLPKESLKGIGRVSLDMGVGVVADVSEVSDVSESDDVADDDTLIDHASVERILARQAAASARQRRGRGRRP